MSNATDWLVCTPILQMLRGIQDLVYVATTEGVVERQHVVLATSAICNQVRRQLEALQKCCCGTYTRSPGAVGLHSNDDWKASCIPRLVEFS